MTSETQASAATYPDLAYRQELADAAAGTKASFAQAFMAMWMATTWADGDTKTQMTELYPKLVKNFQRAYGGIIESRYGSSAAAGVVLLAQEAEASPARERPPERDSSVASVAPQLSGAEETEIHAAGLSDSPRATDVDAFVWWQYLHFDSVDASELLSDLLSLRDRIRTFLPVSATRDVEARDIALRRLYGITRELIESIDGEEQRAYAALGAAWLDSAAKSDIYQTDVPDARQIVPGDFSGQSWAQFVKWVKDQEMTVPYKDQRPSARFVNVVKSLQQRLASDEAVYLAAVQRLAQRTYLSGMFLGAVGLLIPVSILAVATGVIGFSADWLAAAVGGALGAVISVLQRMGRGLELGPEGEKQSFKLQGIFRPTIGAVLGTASFVLLKRGTRSAREADNGRERGAVLRRRRVPRGV